MHCNKTTVHVYVMCMCMISFSDRCSPVCQLQALVVGQHWSTIMHHCLGDRASITVEVGASTNPQALEDAVATSQMAAVARKLATFCLAVVSAMTADRKMTCMRGTLATCCP